MLFKKKGVIKLKCSKDSLGDRIKEYENVNRTYLTKKLPVILRLDGKAWHTLTKGLTKPFDSILTESMQQTMKYLCENIQGCVLGYTQSDEITLVLVDYKNIKSSSWFDNNVQKMCSVSASMATLAFNDNYMKIVNSEITIPVSIDFKSDEYQEKVYKRYNTYHSKLNKALFDSRVFNLPKEEVCNCLIWRQQDAVRNSIEAVGQANFSQKQLHCKNNNIIQEMLSQEKGINWNDTPTQWKRGSCCYRETYKIFEGTEKEAIRSRWVIDKEIPVFTVDRNYIEKLI